MVTLKIDDLSVAIGSKQVLNNLSFALEPGQLIGIIGPNGAGKSTLLRAIMGLLPTTGGRVFLDDRPMSELSAKDRARTIAYLPQGQNIHWPVQVERLIALGRLPHLAPFSHMSPEDVRAIGWAMDEADVRHLAGRTATELSGGERARVLLARALSVGAPVLLADEPLASLDPGHQLGAMSLLRRQASAGKLVVVVLHDLTLASRFCDRLLLIASGGELVGDGCPKQVLSPKAVRQVYGVETVSGSHEGGHYILPWRLPDEVSINEQ